jgi:phosphatidylglycerol:prolipoprotein diacylglycerol transferase
MQQTLFFIPTTVAGYPMFGVGLLLAAWVVACVGIVVWLVWRQGWNADTWGYIPILLLIGIVIRWVLPTLCERQGLPIRGYGMMVMLGVVAATALAAWRAKHRGLDPDVIFTLAFWLLVPGILGARAFYVIEYWPEYVKDYYDPQGGFWPFLGSVVNLTKGGLVVYGSFFGAIVGFLLFVWKHRLPPLALADLIAPSMALGVAIGRIGCLLNGCCYGAVCDHPWAITFPAGSVPEHTPPYRAQVERGQMYGFMLSSHPKKEPYVLATTAGSPADHAGIKSGDRLKNINGYELATNNEAYWVLEQAFDGGQPLHIERKGLPAVTIPAIEPPARSLPVHPTQIYSVIDGLAICLVLLLYGRFFQRRDGELFALIISIYPVTRFFIEGLRTDEAEVAGTGMSIAQNVSLLLLLCAAGLWFYILRQRSGRATFSCEEKDGCIKNHGADNRSKNSRPK